jgi:hypothetical protein
MRNEKARANPGFFFDLIDLVDPIDSIVNEVNPVNKVLFGFRSSRLMGDRRLGAMDGVAGRLVAARRFSRISTDLPFFGCGFLLDSADVKTGEV